MDDVESNRMQAELDRLTKELMFAKAEYNRLLTKMNNRWSESVKQEIESAVADYQEGRE